MGRSTGDPGPGCGTATVQVTPQASVRTRRVGSGRTEMNRHLRGSSVPRPLSPTSPIPPQTHTARFSDPPAPGPAAQKHRQRDGRQEGAGRPRGPRKGQPGPGGGRPRTAAGIKRVQRFRREACLRAARTGTRATGGRHRGQGRAPPVPLPCQAGAAVPGVPVSRGQGHGQEADADRLRRPLRDDQDGGTVTLSPSRRESGLLETAGVPLSKGLRTKERGPQGL